MPTSYSSLTFTIDPSELFCGIEDIPVSAYHLPAIDNVIFNESSGVTVVVWADGERTVVRCGEGETFDRYTGFMAAICKRMFGGTLTAKKLMNSKDKAYQAKLRAEEAEKVKQKHIAEQEEARKKAEARRAKEEAELMEVMTRHFVMEQKAKQRAAEIISEENN